METGMCVCINCGYRMPAPKGVDCSDVLCPKCGGRMKNTGYEPLE